MSTELLDTDRVELTSVDKINDAGGDQKAIRTPKALSEVTRVISCSNPGDRILTLESSDDW